MSRRGQRKGFLLHGERDGGRGKRKRGGWKEVVGFFFLYLFSFF